MKKTRLAAMIGVAAASVLAAGAALAQGGPHRGQGGHGGPDWSAMDVNDDGAVSREEAADWHRARFFEADSDGDGAVTQVELQRHREERREQMRQARADRMFGELDANGDGAVTADELDGREMRMFDRLDENGDGLIDEEERAKRRHGRGKRD